MRKILLIFLILPLIFIGCNDDDDDNNNHSGGTKVTDVDGNEYNTITIGSQVWMAEDLKVTHYRDGSAITHVTDSTEWSVTNEGAYCEYDNDPSNIPPYGRLYNWYAVNDPRGLAPDGWHIPTDDEWKTLEISLCMTETGANGTGYRGSNEGSQLAGRDDLWEDGELDSDPEFGTSSFEGLPAGYRTIEGGFAHSTLYANWWSSTGSDGVALPRVLNYDNSKIARSSHFMKHGFQVRCVRD